MPHIYLLVGSQTGTADIVADAIANALVELDHPVTVCLDPEVCDFEQEKNVVFLLCTSSSGKGQLPSNISSLPEDMLAAQISLEGVRYGVLTLGDSSFPTYGQSGIILDRLFCELGGHRVGTIGLLDCQHCPLPVEPGVTWARQWAELL